jgi:2-polyprenyl-3-methyl-5-hydroxy-6-metoxy-1,4-benzoquinol methylase
MDQIRKKAALDAITRAQQSLSTLAEIINNPSAVKIEEPKAPEPAAPKPPSPQEKPAGKTRNLYANSLPLEDLGPTPDLSDADWPEAIPQNLIVEDKAEPEKQFRALQACGIMNNLGVKFEEAKVLDFGCGEGHITREIGNHAAKVVGYDITPNEKWVVKETDVCTYTEYFEQVQAQAPYDIIIAYDVLDHAVRLEPVELLKRCRAMLSDDGKVFVRFHPWTSRTGGHLYDQKNKAYAHLAITAAEYSNMMLTLPTELGSRYNIKVNRPRATYEGWIKDAGLQILETKAKSTKVEDYFDSLMDRIIGVTWAGKIPVEKAKKIMELQTLDYLLSK